MIFYKEKEILIEFDSKIKKKKKNIKKNKIIIESIFYIDVLFIK